MSSYLEYATLVGRCGAWPVEDLGDLLREIERDDELADAQRSELTQRVYRLLWDRVDPLPRRSAANGTSGD